MDKRLVGKWYKEELGETLNIFDETPLRMKMSFDSSGYYNFEPNCVYEKDEYLCYEINDEQFRMVYHVKYADGKLVGFYTQHGKTTPVIYSKVDDTPEDAPYQYSPQYLVPNTDETRLDALRRCAEYDRNKEDGFSDKYILGGDIPEILSKYNYTDYTKDSDGSSDELAFRLLDFVCDHFGHDGCGGMGASRKIDGIIEFCEGHGGKTNCRGLAIMLAALLRLNGIKARHITCLPYEDPFQDCHVVVDCLLPSGRRIMLDPTQRLYLMDKDGEYISLPRLRELLIDGEPIFASPSASYNGGGFDLKDYRDYMTKNTMRFSRCILHEDGVDGATQRSRYITLIPKGYPAESFPENANYDLVYNDKEFWKM